MGECRLTAQHAMKQKQHLSLTLHMCAPLLVPKFLPSSPISHFPTAGDLGLFLSHPSVNKERRSQQIFVKSQSLVGRKRTPSGLQSPTKAPGQRSGGRTWNSIISPQTMVCST